MAKEQAAPRALSVTGAWEGSFLTPLGKGSASLCPLSPPEARAPAWHQEEGAQPPPIWSMAVWESPGDRAASLAKKRQARWWGPEKREPLERVCRPTAYPLAVLSSRRSILGGLPWGPRSSLATLRLCFHLTEKQPLGAGNWEYPPPEQEAPWGSRGDRHRRLPWHHPPHQWWRPRASPTPGETPPPYHQDRGGWSLARAKAGGGLSLEILRDKCTNYKCTWPPRWRNRTLPHALRGDHCPDFLDQRSRCLLSDFTYVVYTVVVSSRCCTGFCIQCRTGTKSLCAAVCEFVQGHH